MGDERASLCIAEGQRSELGMELVIDDAREGEIQHRHIRFESVETRRSRVP